MAKNHKLRRLRAKNFWTQQDAAKNVGVSLVTYQRWELGIQAPSLVSLKQLCETFQVQSEDLDYGYILPSEADVEPSGSMPANSIPSQPILTSLEAIRTPLPVRFTHPSQATHEDLMAVAKKLFPKEYPPKLNKFQDGQFTCHVFYNAQLDKAFIASIKTEFRRVTAWTLGCQAKAF